MKYLYNVTNEDLQKFGGLFDQIGYPHADGLESLNRGDQEYSETVVVNLETMLDAQILFDYLTTDLKKWNYEPKIRIIFPNNSAIVFNRRGSWDHNLDVNDCLIIDQRTKDLLSTGFPYDIINSKDMNQTIIAQRALIKAQEETIERLRNEVRTWESKIPAEELPF